MALIKICGLRRLEDILTVNEFKPDFVGFIFAENRKRTITVEVARELKTKLLPQIKAVGVFVNQTAEYVAEIANSGIIDLIQLHGQEEETVIKKLKSLTVKPVIKAISVTNAEDISKWENSEADFLLLDNGIGGTGEKFDWSLIREVGKPFFLAGGIDATNILEALAKKPDIIDISGGVETEGFKDRDKIKEIIEIVRKESK